MDTQESKLFVLFWILRWARLSTCSKTSPFEPVGWEPALSPVGFWEEGPALARSRALRTPFLAYSQSREPEPCSMFWFPFLPDCLALRDESGPEEALVCQ